VRVLRRISGLLRGGDSLVVLLLLTAAILLSPPHGGAVSVCMVLATLSVLTGVVLHGIRRAGVRGSLLARLGSWARATVALGISASVLMILGATVAVVG
jgi:hypothetical protein